MFVEKMPVKPHLPRLPEMITSRSRGDHWSKCQIVMQFSLGVCRELQSGLNQPGPLPKNTLDAMTTTKENIIFRPVIAIPGRVVASSALDNLKTTKPPCCMMSFGLHKGLLNTSREMKKMWDSGRI